MLDVPDTNSKAEPCKKKSLRRASRAKRKISQVQASADENPEAGLPAPADGQVYNNTEVVDILLGIKDRKRRIRLKKLWTSGEGRYRCRYAGVESLSKALAKARKGYAIRPFGRRGRSLKITNEALRESIATLTAYNGTFSSMTVKQVITDHGKQVLAARNLALPVNERIDVERAKSIQPHRTTVYRTSLRAITILKNLAVTTSAIYEPQSRIIALKSMMSCASLMLLVASTHYVPADPCSRDYIDYKREESDLDRMVSDYHGVPMMALPPSSNFNIDETTELVFEGERENEVFRLTDKQQSGKRMAKYKEQMSSTSTNAHAMRVNIQNMSNGAGFLAPSWLTVMNLSAQEMRGHKTGLVRIEIPDVPSSIDPRHKETIYVNFARGHVEINKEAGEISLKVRGHLLVNLPKRQITIDHCLCSVATIVSRVPRHRGTAIHRGLPKLPEGRRLWRSNFCHKTTSNHLLRQLWCADCGPRD